MLTNPPIGVENVTGTDKYPRQQRNYERKKHEGKNPMLLLNNIRCKIGSRAFAVIDRA